MKNTHTDCLFCQIAQGDIPAEFVFENEDVVAFRDIAPAAPVHLLFVPKKHITSANDFANGADATVVSRIFEAIAEVAKREGFAESGYRVISNCGKDGGQSVAHLHFHVLAGKPIRFPGFDQ